MYALFGVFLALICTKNTTFNSTSIQKTADISMTDGSQFTDQVLRYHNWFRDQHSAVALTWNTSMAETAGQWAENCVFKHSVS